MNRLHRPLRLLAAAVLPALLITACSHGNGTSPVPSGAGQNSSGRHVRDNSASDLHAAGATFPFQFYTGNTQPTGLWSDAQAAPATGSLFAVATASGGLSSNVYYCGTGSGYGQNAFANAAVSPSPTGACAALGSSNTGAGSEDTTLDFAGSDAAISPTLYSTYKTNREPAVGTNYGEPFEFPVVGGSIAFPYLASDFNGLPYVSGSSGPRQTVKLSRTTYCKIANGTITNWNDAAVYADNGNNYPVDTTVAPADGTSFTAGAAGQSVAIKNFFYRADGSGTQLLFQNHLNSVCGVNWGHGTAKTWVGPVTAEFVGKTGNPGVASAVNGSHYTTGFIEAGYTVFYPNLSVAKLANNTGAYASATDSAALTASLSTVNLNSSGIVVAGAGDNNTGGATTDLGTSRKDCVFYVNPSSFANPNSASAYPIVGISYLYFYGKGYATPGRADAFNGGTVSHYTPVQQLLQYLVGKTGGTTDKRPAAPSGYAYVDSSILNEVYNAIQGSAVGSANFKDASGAAVTRSSACFS